MTSYVLPKPLTCIYVRGLGKKCSLQIGYKVGAYCTHDLFFSFMCTMNFTSSQIELGLARYLRGVMREQEFLVLHPCKTQDSCKKLSFKSCKKYQCKTMQDLVPAKSNRTTGGGYTLEKGRKPAFWVPATSYRTKGVDYYMSNK
jgi:hypothetical protein